MDDVMKNVVLGLSPKPKVWRPTEGQDTKPFKPMYSLPFSERIKEPDKNNPLWFTQATIPNRMYDWVYGNTIIIAFVILLNALSTWVMVENDEGILHADGGRLVWFAILWTFCIEPLYTLVVIYGYRKTGKGMYEDWGYSILSEDYWNKIILRNQREIAEEQGLTPEELNGNVVKIAREVSWTMLLFGVNFIVFGAYAVWIFEMRSEYGWSTGQSFFWDGWMGVSGAVEGTVLWWFGLALVVWLKAGFMTFLHSFPDDLQYWIIHIVQHTPKFLDFCIIKFWPYVDMEERERMGKKWLPEKYPTLHTCALLLWNWQHAAHHCIEYVTVEVKIGAGNLVDKAMELRFVWTWVMASYFMDWCTGGNWSSSQLDFWAFIITHVWRDSFIHNGRELPYSEQLPQFPFISDFGLIRGWDRALESHPMHHWGPSHFSNFSNQGFWDFMLGTDSCYGYDMGVWDGSPLNGIDKQVEKALRFHNYGFSNKERDAKWAAKGANYLSVEDGPPDPASKTQKTIDTSWVTRSPGGNVALPDPVSHYHKANEEGAVGITMESYKLPLLAKEPDSEWTAARPLLAKELGPDGEWTDTASVAKYEKPNMRWTPGVLGVLHRVLTYSLAALGVFVWVIAIYHSQTCSNPTCGD